MTALGRFILFPEPENIGTHFKIFFYSFTSPVHLWRVYSEIISGYRTLPDTMTLPKYCNISVYTTHNISRDNVYDQILYIELFYTWNCTVKFETDIYY